MEEKIQQPIELVEVGCTNCREVETVNSIFAKALALHKKSCYMTRGCQGYLTIKEKKISKELKKEAEKEEEAEKELTEEVFKVSMETSDDEIME